MNGRLILTIMGPCARRIMETNNNKYYSYDIDNMVFFLARLLNN